MAKKTERIATEAADKTLRPYSKPTLNKGPVLSQITAIGASSGITDTLAT